MTYTSKNAARDAKIVKLWNAGMTSGQIAAKLKLESRNVVIGAIGRARERGETVVSVNAQDRSKRQSEAQKFMRCVPVGEISRRRRQAQAVCGSGITTAKNGNGGYVSKWVGSKECVWPDGDPKAKGFRFCGAPAELGRPYCQNHCARAYDRRATADLHDRAMPADVRAVR